ncbi:MAG: MscS Mechanosensitive ion channel [Polaromonas sp.]|nr:MscS Mechanosensitive ion channel [Polaromonas sp.]
MSDIAASAHALNQMVKNYRRMEKRRIAFNFGVTCGATAEQAEAIPGIIKRLV